MERGSCLWAGNKQQQGSQGTWSSYALMSVFSAFLLLLLFIHKRILPTDQHKYKKVVGGKRNAVQSISQTGRWKQTKYANHSDTIRRSRRFCNLIIRIKRLCTYAHADRKPEQNLLQQRNTNVRAGSHEQPVSRGFIVRLLLLPRAV
jgi:hypothetical protein